MGREKWKVKEIKSDIYRKLVASIITYENKISDEIYRSKTCKKDATEQIK